MASRVKMENKARSVWFDTRIIGSSGRIRIVQQESLKLQLPYRLFPVCPLLLFFLLAWYLSIILLFSRSHEEQLRNDVLE